LAWGIEWIECAYITELRRLKTAHIIHYDIAAARTAFGFH
jgi:hypothetical protein